MPRINGRPICAQFVLIFAAALHTPTRGGEADSTYQQVVAPFLAQHCVRCHNPEKKSGEFSLHSLSASLAKGYDVDTWLIVATKLKDGEMPPEDQKQPPPEVIEKVLAWIKKQSNIAGAQGIVPEGNLRSGNHVPHELLFGRPSNQPGSSPARLWRISPDIYKAFSTQVSKDTTLSQPFAVPPGEGFKDVAAGFGLDEAATNALIRNSETLVNVQLGLEKTKTALMEFQPLLQEEKIPTRARIESALIKEFDIVLKRKPTSDELKSFVDLYEQNRKIGGAVIGARLTLMAVFLLPEAIFRSEVGAGNPDVHGRRILAPREMAFAIAYGLTDRAPDAQLLKAAETGALSTRKDAEREVARLLNTEGMESQRILRFFQEYFGYTKAPQIFKDPKTPGHFSAHKPEFLVDDTNRLILTILKEDKNVLKELLSTRRSFVTIQNNEQIEADEKRRIKKERELKEKEAAGLLLPPKPATPPKPKKVLTPEEQERQRLKDIEAAAKYVESRSPFKAYNVTERQLIQPVELPADQRAGILTQPSWLVSHSDNFDNHAILRGKWIRERLLGGVVPDIPISVDAQLPDDKTKTLRERMEVTRQAYCWQCHQKMNPAGLAFEMFDHFGRYRTTELGKPVIAEAKLEKTGDPALEGDYPNAVAMMRKLAASEHVRQVFVRHAFRYWIGRDETVSDASTLQSADRAYVASGGSMKALVAALLTSDAFLYRTVPGVVDASKH